MESTGKTIKLVSHRSPLEIASRFPHSLRPTTAIMFQFTTLKGAFLDHPLPSLQAHSSIGKDWARQSNFGNHGGAVTSLLRQGCIA